MYYFRILIASFAVLSGVAVAGGFSEEAKAAEASMPRIANCQDSFMADLLVEREPSQSKWITLLNDADSNNDGKMTYGEASGYTEIISVFDEIDENGNRELDQLEAKRFTAKMVLHQYTLKFLRLDLSGDKMLSSYEVSRIQDKDSDVVSLDAGFDSMVSFDEFMEWRKGSDGIDLKSLFRQLQI
jgi:hypothetical protein